MRELLNVSYVALVQNKDDDELRAFDGQLEAAPGERPRNQSRGVSSLMQSMKMPKKG